MRISDWSSDVCSSDLVPLALPGDALDPARPGVDRRRRPGTRSADHRRADRGLVVAGGGAGSPLEGAGSAVRVDLVGFGPQLLGLAQVISGVPSLLLGLSALLL